MLTGSLVAIVTPMQEGGALDLPALRRLIDFHVANGTSGIVIVGTTGESPTVDFDEHCLLIKTAVDHAAGRIPVMAGTGANSTAEAVELAAYAAKVGANSHLSVVPYYNKPTQEGLYRHFRTIAEKVALPMVLYNVPGRTVADLATETTLRLAQVPGIVGIKDATADVGRGSELIKALAEAGHRDFAVYSGEDITGLPLMLMGGHGVISVTANVAPKLMGQMCAAAQAGDVATARARNDRLLALHRRLFVEANPIPTKWALAEMGLIHNELRLPLVKLSPQFHDTVRAALRDAGCLAQG
ncbi:MAG: 4-hydroxy-tetrahydrodipicolinate synthase [Betaproteobacteria bacterium]|nr:4-hydroxy-tetrahydrodipicolinate synthase [Betaproteobacteria bacterium]MCC7216262.1 4-hydroxy-tetrahydrodipicolinate synthase [Burkholderiales bacterium]